MSFSQWQYMYDAVPRHWNDLRGPVWKDKDSDRWIWEGFSPLSSGLYMASTVGAVIKEQGGDTWNNSFRVYNERPYYQLGFDFLWYTGSGWVISRKVGAGIEERWRNATISHAIEVAEDNFIRVVRDAESRRVVSSHTASTAELTLENAEAAKEEYEQYVGDEWWECEEEGTSAIAGRYRPRGSLRGPDQNYFKADQHRAVIWELGIDSPAYIRTTATWRTDPAGRYSKYSKTMQINWDIIDGGEDPDTVSEVSITEEEETAETETLRIGLYKFRGMRGNKIVDRYTETSEVFPGGRKKYGSIYYHSQRGKWVIGNLGIDRSWHESDEEPNVDGSVLFQAMKRVGLGDPEPNYDETPGDLDIDVIFHSLVFGQETLNRPVVQAALFL